MSASPPENLKNRCLLRFLASHLTHLSYVLFRLPVLTSRKCQRLCKFGSSNFLVKRWEKLFLLLSSRPSTLGIVQEPLPQERDASTAIHGSFERLQFIDLSLGNALAPRQTQSSMHGVIVLLDPGHEAPQFRNATFGSLLHPGRQIVMFALAHHREKG